MTIGERIKYYREQRGWTQAELAQKMGYASKSGVSRTETAGNDIGTARVVEFAKALGIKPSELLGHEEATSMLDVIPVNELWGIMSGTFDDIPASKESLEQMYKDIFEYASRLRDYFSLNEKYKELAEEYISKLLDLQITEEKRLN